MINPVPKGATEPSTTETAPQDSWKQPPLKTRAPPHAETKITAPMKSVALEPPRLKMFRPTVGGFISPSAPKEGSCDDTCSAAASAQLIADRMSTTAIALTAASRYDGHIMRPMPFALAAVCTVALTGVVLQPWQPLYAQEAASVNRVIEQLRQGRPAIGTFTRTARPDLDFAVIDEQYGDFDIDGVREAVVAIRAGDGAPAITPVVRIPLAARDAPEAVVKQVLDAGALGVMFPDIETRAQAMAAVGSMRVARAAGADIWPFDPAGTLVAMLQIEIAGRDRASR